MESTRVYWITAYALYFLGLFLPRLALTVRRLHDIGGTGWIVLAFGAVSSVLGEAIGSIVYLIVMTLPGMRSRNKYGAVPGSKEAAAETAESLRRRGRSRRKSR